jgi:hypothetical protein
MEAGELVELAIAVALLALTIAWRPWIEPHGRGLAQRAGWCMLILAVLPVVLRLALLRHHPAPSPDVYDEFGHLLVADTLRHFRLANPAHPMHRFFETFFVLQKPVYSSIYPVGQGVILAIGKAIFGNPWAGVLLSTSALCSLCYWMLRGWTTPSWALAGGIFAIFEFGPLNQWMNSYWGGSFAAAGGCLVFGALPRLRDLQLSGPQFKQRRIWMGACLGVGLGINLITRPYESIFLLVSVIAFLIPTLKTRESILSIRSAMITTVLVVLPAIGVTLLQNKRVTGNWTTLPYQLSQYQYGVPASLTFQPDPIPHSDLTPQQQLEYQAQLSFRDGRETIKTYLLRLEYRVRFYRFFFLPALFIALPFFLFVLKQPRFQWVAFTLVLFALGINFFPAFQFHYLAAITCLFVLVSVVGLAEVSRFSPFAARLIVFLCVAHFAFWYTLHLFDPQTAAIRQYETWDGLNHGNPERRIQVNHALALTPGKILVFVRYSPQHIFQEEWVYNDADIDGARIVWARDLGPSEDAQLRAYYPGRTALLLEPDYRPPRLTSYKP